MKNISIIVMASALLGVCSCKKSKEAEYDSWANKATEVIRSGATNGVNWQTNSQFSNVMTVLAKTVKLDTTKETFISISEAGEFLSQLHDSDHLPGIAKDEHGQMDCDVPIMDSNQLLSATYPIERTFHFVKDSYTSTNNYIVVKDSKNAEWKLQRAWETDSKGQIIQEWPVK